ncbi:MAG: extracellular solute-binding protein, partial [Burkholderiales bacterium]
GGTMVDDASGRVRFDGPEGRSAILAVAKMTEVGKMRSMDWSTSRQSFFAGKVGMLVASSASLNQFDRSISSRFSWNVATIPLQGDKARLAAGGAVAVIHSTDAAKQKAAWDFVNFATGPVGSTHQVKMVGYLPTNQMVVSSPAHLAGFYASNPKYAKSAEVMPLLTPWYGYRGENGLKIVDLMRKSLGAITEKKANPEQTLKELTVSVQPLLPAK